MEYIYFISTPFMIYFARASFRPWTHLSAIDRHFTLTIKLADLKATTFLYESQPIAGDLSKSKKGPFEVKEHRKRGARWRKPKKWCAPASLRGLEADKLQPSKQSESDASLCAKGGRTAQTRSSQPDWKFLHQRREINVPKRRVPRREEMKLKPSYEENRAKLIAREHDLTRTQQKKHKRIMWNPTLLLLRIVLTRTAPWRYG